ncbi:methylmalonyl Co-A mutase-associated GTPase MeaB [Reichenbachiella carrageenanivorans]|uniref:Methylmalonyl Co-A mutase-associated GTPase MeaB n=1 Tax=Reichenbachiella carrageenanivorans TaxID=2979869 RepID=A0ABY6CXJ7_9BACT|nr:methylmalonyl Co-A mutase-associated GTPase MeaB [Reichenbachiella carrageenanivorans]UXX78079.1 methylmalonyl Co-A mutase-associated GTPase MeaB [Reichenbachiella carrageenanivorans]
MKRFDLDYYLNGLKAENTVVLAQAITLIESKRRSDQDLGDLILTEILKEAEPSIRIGITGTPGVGKSSFIEGFGSFLISQGKKVAVLAIDPSSQRTGGSILGDKTRMEMLSKNPKAYIRPSASGSALGGVNNRTRESILLCEAAGFDAIIVETVGVGQSETLVNNMVDFFLLMIQPGSGDDLQGIKKGIMEMANGIVINKADGDQAKLAKRSKTDLLSALHLFAISDSGWQTQVELCSALEHKGFDKVWSMISSFEKQMKGNGLFAQNRCSQNVTWFEDRVNLGLLQVLTSQPELTRLHQQLKYKVQENECSVSQATAELLALARQLLA